MDMTRQQKSILSLKGIKTMNKMIINFNGPIHICGAGVSHPGELKEIRELIYNIMDMLDESNLDTLYEEAEDEYDDSEDEFSFDAPTVHQEVPAPREAHPAEKVGRSNAAADEEDIPLLFSFFIVDPAVCPPSVLKLQKNRPLSGPVLILRKLTARGGPAAPA